MFARFLGLCVVVVLSAGAPVWAQPADPAASLLKLVRSGRVTAERLPAVYENICSRGGAESLGYVFESVVAKNELSAEDRRKALGWLADAVFARKLAPAGDLSALAKLLAEAREANDAETLRPAARLAGLTKAPGVEEELGKIAAANVPAIVRRTAMNALADFGSDAARGVLLALAQQAPAIGDRFAASAAAASFDLDRAATFAAAALVAATPDDAPDALLEAFLARKEGPDKLAAALANAVVSPDVAKRALRFMYSIGRSDAALSNRLSELAGIAADQPPPTLEEIAALVKDVEAHGDPARGEQVFRRNDLSCMKCHAIRRAGGQIGPELTALGGISPTDYIANSILNPNLAIKEAFVTKVIETTDGKIYTGIVATRDDAVVKLKLASGAIETIPIADIETEEEGRSLMPQGLTKFLAKQELLDLIAFVSALGRPGAYGPTDVTSVQRWLVMPTDDPELTTAEPNLEAVRFKVVAAPADAWSRAYAMADGRLPLDELRKPDGPKTFYLKGEVALIEPGHITFEVVPQPDGVATPVWIEGRPAPQLPASTLFVGKGTRTIIVKVTLDNTPDRTLHVNVRKPDDSKAQYDVVGGG